MLKNKCLHFIRTCIRSRLYFDGYIVRRGFIITTKGKKGEKAAYFSFFLTGGHCQVIQTTVTVFILELKTGGINGFTHSIPGSSIAEVHINDPLAG